MPVHRQGPSHDDAIFTVGSGYGVGRPQYYVTLDENDGERSWWLDPESAVALGQRLLMLGQKCKRLNKGGRPGLDEP